MADDDLEDSSDDSEDSSDDSYSYKNIAKKSFKTAKKKIAAVESSATPALFGHFSSDSDDSKKNSEAIQVATKTSERPKRKDVKFNVTRKSKRLRSGRFEVFGSGSNPQNEVTDELSTDCDAVEYLDSQAAFSSSRKTSIPGTNLVKCNILSSDEIESDVNSEDVFELSDSSEVALLSSPDIAVVSKNDVENDSNELLSIKISWKLQPIQKFQLRRHQKFKTLMEHFSQLEGVPLEKIVIYGGRHHGRLIEPYDTPDTLGVTVTDVLEGGVLVEGGEARAQRSRGLAGHQGDGIKVRVQLEEVRSFHVMIGRQQKMHVLAVKVAEQLEVDVGKVRLSLDGEPIDSELTAGQLDLEEGDVLDVRLLL